MQLTRTRLVVVLLAVAAALTPPLPTIAQEPTSGEIEVRTHSGPGAPASPAIRLFRNGGTADLWPTYCGPAAGQPGYTSCDSLPEGTYTFGVGGVPAGMTVAPSCNFHGVSGEFYPLNVGSAADHTTGAWNWGWDCELFVGHPGVIVQSADETFAMPTVEFDGGPASCVDSSPYEGSTIRWCTAPAPGSWTIEPVTTDGWVATAWCEPVGTYLQDGFPQVGFTFSTTTDDPLWRCWIEYRQDALVWYIAAEPGSPDAAWADAPWKVVRSDDGEDVSASCRTTDAPDLGALVAYECSLPAGTYSVVIEGFTVTGGRSGCTDVVVYDRTYCSALEIAPTVASYVLTTWAAPGETWPEAVTIDLTGGPDDARTPPCRVLADDVIDTTDTAVYRQRWGACSPIEPGTYSFVLGGAPAGSTVETAGCDGFELELGTTWECSIEIRTVDPVDESPPEQPVATLPTTGTGATGGIAISAAVALATGGALLMAARSRRRPATARGGAAGR